MIQVSPSTVLSWIEKGLLPAYRTPGGHRRVDSSALLRFLREHEMPIPRELAPVTRLLVIDDDEDFLGVARRLLKRALPLLEVDTAEGAVDGLLKVGTFRPDAVLLDAFMPNIDGLEVCRRIRGSDETNHIMVIALTGRPSPDVAESFVAAGADACVAKPLDTDELLELIDSDRARERLR
jgi:excisionase family DNA binding protein